MSLRTATSSRLHERIKVLAEEADYPVVSSKDYDRQLWLDAEVVRLLTFLDTATPSVNYTRSNE